MSIVYFSPAKSGDEQGRLAALKRVLKALEPVSVFAHNDIVPVKLTIGDTACRHHLSPGFIASIIQYLKERNVRPFIFDTSVIYKGSRQNAVDHLALAEEKGFTYAAIGAPFVIADGVFGSDGKELAVTDARYIKKIKVPSFIGNTDSVVVVSHVTGHILAGYAGALKNVAMGMVCRPSKQVQHSTVKPRVRVNSCVGCGACVKICPVTAIRMSEKKAAIDPKVCVGCGECLCACRYDAISISFQEDPAIFGYRMAECARAVLSRYTKAIFITGAFDITKDCDCISDPNTDVKISPDLGVFASLDPVAVDKAVIDALSEEGDIFQNAWKTDAHRSMLEYAARIGVGSLQYEITNV